MHELRAYCISCKESKTTSDFEIKKRDSGRYFAHGVCPSCGTPIARIIREEVTKA